MARFEYVDTVTGRWSSTKRFHHEMEPQVAEELQKHHLLVKLLKMTTSSSDAEALVAMRKANDLLASAGWDWDRLMAGKITVVGDPFAGLGDPTPRVRQDDSWQRPAAPTQPAAPRPTLYLPVASTKPNSYEGHCYCCGKLVAVRGGFIFKARDYHSRAPAHGWQVICTTDNVNRNATIGPSAAPRVGRGARKVTADDLA